jgi:cell division protein FtsB
MVLVLFFVYSVVWSDIGFIRYYSMKRSVAIKEKELFDLKEEAKSIEKQIAEWKESAFSLEKMAREELGMGKKNEITYVYRRS